MKIYIIFCHRDLTNSSQKYNYIQLIDLCPLQNLNNLTFISKLNFLSPNTCGAKVSKANSVPTGMNYIDSSKCYKYYFKYFWGGNLLKDKYSYPWEANDQQKFIKLLKNVL